MSILFCQLRKDQIVQNDGVVYAKGKLIIWLSRSVFSPSVDMNTVKDILITTQVKKIAIANPSLAPYGVVAEKVLKNWVNWKYVNSKIILGENIGQVAQFALSGSVQVAFLPMSFGLNPQLQQNGILFTVDESQYEPIMQRMVLLSSNPIAKDFYQFIMDKSNQRIWEKYGYAIP
jgi:molybdate transport system substrate-binding protein